MAVRGVEVEPVDPAELAHPLEALRSERLLALERMENDAFQEIPEGDLVVLGDRLEHFQDSLLHPDTSLHALHDSGGSCGGRTSCGSTHGPLLRPYGTLVPR